MKNTLIAVLAVLLAIAVYLLAQDRMGNGHVPGPVADPEVQPLPKEAEAALKLTEEDAVVAIVRANGSIQLLVPSGTKHTKVELPIDHPVTLRDVRSISIASYTGSPTCLLWRYDVVVGGTHYDQYCVRWRK